MLHLHPMWTYPGFDPVALSLGPLKIRWYGLMYLLAFAAAWWLARRRAKKPDSGWTPVQVDDLIFYGAMGIILGGRIGYMLFYGGAQILDNPLSILKIWEGGMSFHGGLPGVIIGLGPLRHLVRAVGIYFLIVAGATLAVAWDFITPNAAGSIARIGAGWVGAVVIIFGGADTYAWWVSRRRYR